MSYACKTMSQQSASKEAEDSHEVEGAIRRYEGDGPVVLEARQPDTLVKFDVLQVHRLVLRAASLVVKQHLRQTNQHLNSEFVGNEVFDQELIHAQC